MVLKIKLFVIFITIFLFSCCKQDERILSRIEGKQLKISNTIDGSYTIDDFIAPYRNRIKEILDSTLAYSPRLITKYIGKYNTNAGNLMADIVFRQTNPIFKKLTGHTIDFVLLNHGGIRSVISKGNITARTAYKIMPFENSILVVKLDSNSLRDLVSFLIKSGRAHPISGIQIILNSNGDLKTFLVQGKPFDESKTYYIATSDYLINGGSNMNFFKNNLGTTDIDYKIRNAMIDYFKNVDTVSPVIDNRFIRLN